MRTETKTVYISFDGKSFDTAAECRAYEKDNNHFALVGLTLDQVEAALSRDDKHLGDAIEAVATRIRQKRIADGDLKRERRKDGEGEPESSGAPQESVKDTEDGQVENEPDLLNPAAA